MTNRKIKGNAVYANMKAQQSFLQTGRNLMTFYLAMLDSGISKAKIKEFDSKLLKDEVAKFRQDGKDGILDHRINDFLKFVGIPRNRLDKYVQTHNAEALKAAKLTGNEFNVVFECMGDDLAIYLLLLNRYFGYGQKRLCRVLSYMEQYNGDPFSDAEREFGFVYGDKSEIPDMSLYRREKIKINREDAERMRAEMQAVKMIQGV